MNRQKKVNKFFHLFLNDRFIGSLILLNAFVTVYLCYDDAPYYRLFFEFDNLLTGLFIIEIIVKLYCFGKLFFKNKGNVFDFFVVLISSLPMFLSFLKGYDNVNDLNYLLVLRSFRLFKFLRLTKFIPNLKKLSRDLIRALKASVGILAGWLITSVILATILCSIFKTITPEYFGDPLTSFYTLFRLFTIEGWYEIPDSMALSLGYGNGIVIKYLFSLIVLLGGIFGMSFLNSVFVDEILEDNNDEIIAKIDVLTKKIDELSDQLNKKETD